MKATFTGSALKNGSMKDEFFHNDIEGRIKARGYQEAVKKFFDSNSMELCYDGEPQNTLWRNESVLGYIYRIKTDIYTDEGIYEVYFDAWTSIEIVQQVKLEEV